MHGRLLTAWSAAGVLGPVLVNYIREFQIEHGIPKNQAYNVTMYIMAGLLVVAFFANLAVKPVAGALPRAHGADRWAGRSPCDGLGARRYKGGMEMTTANAESGSHDPTASSSRWPGWRWACRCSGGSCRR